MAYQRFKLSTNTPDGDPGPLPAALVGLAAASLADLPKALNPCPAEWADTGFQPTPDAPATTSVVDVPTFFMRFTAAERIAIRGSKDVARGGLPLPSRRSAHGSRQPGPATRSSKASATSAAWAVSRR